MIKEFKKFIARGNVIDLAVGVIMGAAFGKIVTSLVSDVLTPVLGIVMGGIDFTGLNITIKDSVIAYGNFIQNIIDFLIQAFCIFIMIKLINKFFHKKEEEEKKAPVKSQEVVLLEEIRDLLKETNIEKENQNVD
ncbi:MAG: large-conductance mechanosensitive channel protein MscL [Clostridia bacterium]